MPPSHVKKEEAELRKIARKARDNRMAAQGRERKQRQRERLAAAKNGEVEGASPVAAAAAAKKKRGAIIMPDEVRELRQRLLGDDTPNDSGSNSIGTAVAGKKAKTNKKSAAAAGKKTSNPNGAASITPSTPASSSFLVPTYHQEVHFKKKMFFVDVVLHHVPHQKINVSETNNRQLVVHTTNFTKKYRLVLPFPDGMQCDAAAATYDFEHGVLSCKLPIVDGTLPKSLEAENEKMVEKMRQQQALRFRVTQDGDLTVRTRHALLAPTEAAQAALHQTAKEAKSKQTTGEAKENSKVKKRSREAAAMVVKGEEAPQPTKASRKDDKTSAVATADAPAEEPSAKSTAKPNVFQAENAKAMEAAKAAAEKVHLSIREKMMLAKTVQAARQERLKTRSLRKERKEAQRQQSFQRVLDEQKQQLLTRAALQQPPAPHVTAKSGGPSKSVSFADA